MDHEMKPYRDGSFAEGGTPYVDMDGPSDRNFEEVNKGEIEIPEEDGDGNPDYINFSWKKLWMFTGPGWLMSMAYLDPGNLTSDLQQGAYTAYQLLWVLWWATVVGWVLQCLSARLAVTTGQNLAEHCRAGYPRWAAYVLFFQIEVAIIAADVQEVLGSAIGFKVLSDGKIPLYAGCLITAVTTFGFLAVQKIGVRYLEAFIALLIGIMAITFFINWGISGSSAEEFMYGWVVPDISFYALVQAVGIIGAVIMPHNLYLHSGLVLSRKIDKNNEYKVAEGNYYNGLESALALFVSYWINAAIVAVFSSNFYDETCASSSVSGGPFGCVSFQAIYDSTAADDRSLTERVRTGCQSLEQACGVSRAADYTTLETMCNQLNANPTMVVDAVPQGFTCSTIGLDLAGTALESRLGPASKYIWGMGLLAAGQAATTTATMAGQIVFQGFVKIDLPMWQVMLITRLAAIGPALALALAMANNQQLQARMNEWLNVLQSIQLPFALFPVLHFSSKKSIMGRFANGRITKMICWVMALLILGVNIYLVFTTLPKAVYESHAGMALITIWMILDYSMIAFISQDEIKTLFRVITMQESVWQCIS